MKTRTMLSRAALVALSLAACAAPSCAKPPPPGELMVVLKTDLALPKDIDAVLLEVLVRGDPRFKQQFDKLGADESIKLPAWLGVTVGDGHDPTTPVTIRVTALQQGKARVVREVVTTVPEDRAATLPVPIQWLCTDQAPCAEGLTCIAGNCADKKVDSSTLDVFTTGDAVGAGDGKGDGLCFDVAACFAASADAPVDVATCSIKATGDVNVGIRTESSGMCGPAGCIVALDARSDGGWQPGPNGTIKLPPAVCDRLAEHKALGVSIAAPSSACMLKTEDVATCGPWSSSGKAPPAPGSVTPVTLAANQNQPVSLAVAGGNVYWTNAGAFGQEDGEVKRVPIDGGTTSLLAANQDTPKGITVACDAAGESVAAVYWANNGSAGKPGIFGVDPSDPTASPLTLFKAKSLVSPEGLTARGGNIYFTDYSGSAVYSLGLTSGIATAIASPSNNSPQKSPYRITADATTLYWTNQVSAGSVMMADLMDPSPSEIPPTEIPPIGNKPGEKSQSTPGDLALETGATGSCAKTNATAVYWASYDSGAVWKASITAGPPETTSKAVLVIDGQSYPYGVAVDNVAVYWTNHGDNTVWKLPKDGGKPAMVATDQSGPGAIVVDDQSVYWINEGTAAYSGAIMKISKNAPPPPPG